MATRVPAIDMGIIVCLYTSKPNLVLSVDIGPEFRP